MADTGLSLLLKPTTIKFMDGSEHELKLGYLAWAHLEELFGSFDAALIAGASIRAGARVGNTVLRFLWAGLLYERLDEDLKPIGKQWTIGEVESLLHPTKRTPYILALTAAVEAAQFEVDPQ
jgi:hypothetical protein